jgi:nucleoside 2-deoxyribosyltransferase
MLPGMKLYLAGPDVFLADAAAVGARKRAMCRERGFEGLFPLDAELEGGADAASIFRANCARMERADGGLFNLTPFRGPSADAGTLFELGFMFARGKAVHGYASVGGTYVERVRRAFGGLEQRADQLWDPDGVAVEDFELPENLMIVRALAEAGGQLTVVEEEGPGALAAFRAFEACLETVRRSRAG